MFQLKNLKNLKILPIAFYYELSKNYLWLVPVPQKHSEMMDSTLHERSALEQDLQKIQGTIKTKEDELCEIKERLKYQVQVRV